MNFLARLKPAKIESHLIEQLSKQHQNSESRMQVGGGGGSTIDPKDIKVSVGPKSDITSIGGIAPKDPESPR